MPGRGPVPRRIRLWALIAASVVLVVAVANLVLVAEPAARVEPAQGPGQSWQTGSAVAQREGSFSWTFEVTPRGGRIVELDLSAPFAVEVTHVWGHAALAFVVTVLVDGDEVVSDAHAVAAEPRANQTERVQRRMTAIGDMGGVVSPFRVVRTDDAAFAVAVDWSWSYTGSEDAEVTFRTALQPVGLRSVDSRGLPVCDGAGCARGLLLLAVVGQAVAMGWFLRAPRDGGPSQEGPSGGIGAVRPTERGGRGP